MRRHMQKSTFFDSCDGSIICGKRQLFIAPPDHRAFACFLIYYDEGDLRFSPRNNFRKFQIDTFIFHAPGPEPARVVVAKTSRIRCSHSEALESDHGCSYLPPDRAYVVRQFDLRSIRRVLRNGDQEIDCVGAEAKDVELRP